MTILSSDVYAIVWEHSRKPLSYAGMEMMASRFQVVVTAMRKKPYDYLDQRKMDFDSDFDEFKRSIQELHVR